MIKRFFGALFLSLAMIAGGVSAVLMPTVAHAQVDTGLSQVGQTIKLTAQDPRVIASNIINIALSLIGIVLVVLILYGGFVYMTSGGDDAKVASAKKIITNAVIGLVIVLSSWAIARFVLTSLLNATQEGGAGGTVTGSGGGLGGGFAGGGGAEPFRAKSISPSGSVPLRNVQVKIVFNKPVDTAGSSAITVMKNGGATVAGTVDIAGTVATFTPTQSCPAPNADRKCFDADADFVVKLGGTLRSVSGQTISCSGFGTVCQGTFHTGSVVDTKPPTVKMTYPTDGMSVKANSLLKVQADAADDAGVATVEFLDGSSSISVEGPTASTTPLTFSAVADWMTNSASLGAHTLAAVAHDVDSNTSDRSSVSVVVRPESCFNGKQDSPGETGIDCGGDASAATYCGACAAGSCTKNSDCSSGFCSAGKCVVQPIINAVSPDDGKAGTFVTISGANFGYSAGTVTFMGASGSADDKIAVSPAACGSAGTWSNSQIVVEVPTGAASGPILVKNTSSGLSDATNDTSGPAVPDFIVNDNVYPGLCSLAPTSGSSGTVVAANGQNLGTTGNVNFSTETKTTAASVDTWSSSQVRFKVPVVDIGDQRVVVKTGALSSNPVTFSVTEKAFTSPPVIAAIDPAQGPQQQYVTISGNNFGYSLGKVTFTGPDGSQALGDTSFPSACGAGFWRDDRIVIKVPSKFTNGKNTDDGKYTVSVQRPDGTPSNTIGFAVDSTVKLTPGVCAIEPSAGPKGTAVKVYGDQFGVEKPFVTFYLGKAAAVSSNSNQQINTNVPDGALTGPVSVKVGGIGSNTVNFQVRNCNEAPDICAAGKEQCCPTGECRATGDTCGVKALSSMYSWQSSTGLIPTAPTVIEECGGSTTPSPSPWDGRAGGSQAPVDATVYLRFSRVLQKTTVLPSSFRFLKCTSKSSEPCATQEPVTFTLSQGVEGTDQYLTELTPASAFATGTTYEVKVLSTVKADGADGATMDVMKRCGTGSGGETYGYCFRFETRASSDPSKIGSVDVAPSSYVMSFSGQTAPYKAVPLASDDACIVLNCRKYDWNWYTGTKTASDARASITNARSGGLGMCEQTATGIAETLKVPVTVNAEISGTGPTGKGDLFVNFLPPKIESYFPNCQEACSNVLVWAQFTSELDVASVEKPGNVEIRKCRNENCIESELGPALTLPSGAIDVVPALNTTETAKRVITIKTVSGGTVLFDAGAFYRVLLKGGPGVTDGIKGKNGVPMDGANHPLGFQWNFRIKQGTDALCKAEKVEVTPSVKYESVIGARQLFTSVAFGKPDQCSANGQTLTPLTPAEWSSSDTKVADIYKISTQLVDTGATLPPGCSGSCKATGSAGRVGAVAVCGNGVIETSDKNWCSNLGLSGPKCVTMPGSNAGEECEPSINGSSCDPTTCLFLPVKSVKSGGTCGDGTVNFAAGETCDMGLRCVGGSHATSTTAVPEYSPCTSSADQLACAAAGGTCDVYAYRGCSAECRHLGSVSGKSTCGNGDVLGDGKDCDDGNTTNGDGCSNICLHEGSSPAVTIPSVCGNAVLEPGETCELAFTGEPWSAVPGCDSRTCLHTGTSACSTTGGTACCGNGKIESGEDCDDGNSISGDGCSSSCLLEGSSVSYSDTKGGLAPSFCGNGVLEYGEQCEAGGLSSDKVAQAIGYTGTSPSLSKAISSLYRPQKGDGLSDPSQLAFIVGEKLPDSTGVITAELNVKLEGQTGKATYGVQCGLKDENACPVGTGLDQFGCCAPRPQVDDKYPTPSASGVCRNVLIQAGFNVPMDAGSVINNIEISESTTTSKCASGTQEVFAFNDYSSGFFGWIHRTWDRIVAFVTGQPVFADRYCKGNVTGQLAALTSSTSSRQFAFTLDHALAPNTKYRVRFLGDNSTSTDPLSDNADPAKKLGVKTQRGVVRENSNGDTGALIWTFTTGNSICSVNTVTISDATPDPKLPQRPHPFLFINANNQPETRSFAAVVQSLQGGVAVPLSTTAEYAWDWLPWTSGNDKLVSVIKSSGPDAAKTDATSNQLNGTTVLTAGVQIGKDTVNVPPTASSTVKGVAPVTVLACQNPWPSVDASPFRDMFGSPNFGSGDPFASGPFYNFSTMYCRDAGKNDASELLPSLQINQIMPSISDYAQGILRQYLFTYPVDSALPSNYQGLGLKQDGIGIRIVSNPQHLSPEAWYASRGFTGSPTAVLVDGYPAIKDGTTVYVAASNRPQGATGKIYSNIYLISYNAGAKAVTQQIFDQMVKYLTFNINKEFADQSNVCVNAFGAPYQNSAVNNGSPVACKADYECLQYDPALHCDSTKLKLIRDTLRLVDFQFISQTLDESKDPNGRFPQLSGGTFLQDQTNSIWGSWSAQLGAAAGNELPKDPINKFLTCGRCSTSGAPCQVSGECGEGQTCKGGSYVSGSWKADDNIDPQSCWNQSAHTFVCPAIPSAGTYGVSRLYRYKTFSGGLRYDLGAEFEVPPTYDSTGKPALDTWWSPPLAQGRYMCANMPTTSCANSSGTGGDDKLCRPCPNGVCTTCQSGPDVGKFCAGSTSCSGGAVCGGDDKYPVTFGACRLVGGTMTFTNICQNVATGDAGRCGDGILNTGEVCDAGMTSSAACTTTGGQKGHKKQICDLKDCSRYIDDPTMPACIADAVCGNGRIDKACVGGTAPGTACSVDTDCTGGGTCKAESCDDGVLNGKYGQCNTTCTGYASYCGDGEISPGEVCDLGSKNGGYCSSLSGCTDTASSCGLDCKGPGPYCGDAVTNGPEECDGQGQVTSGAICSSGSVGKTCSTDADCGTGGKCGGTPTTQSCAGVTASETITDSTGKLVTILHDTQHVRTCNAPGTASQCKFTDWSTCVAKGSCGDGVLDSGEECDAGSANSDTGACTKTCKKNVCGDGKPNIGVEECDNGADNGKVTCSADYGSSCLSCTASCRWQATAGGYCGDGTKNGPEQCDGGDGISGVTCQSLGYDFGVSSIASQPSGGSGYCVFDSSSADWGNPAGAAAAKAFMAGAITCTKNADCAGSAGSIVSTAFGKKYTVGAYSVAGTCYGNNTLCTSSCSYGSCGRCSDTDSSMPKQSITGFVRDAVYVNAPVSGARVTLMYKGVKVSEVTSKTDGAFTFDNLISHPACGSYKIIVDYYGDNTNTPEYDESVAGGYWPYTSNPFSAATFRTSGLENTDGYVYLLPRVRKYETLATVQWQGSLGGKYIDAHLLMPTGMSYTRSGGTYAACTGTSCLRDIYWGSPGVADLKQIPYAKLYCYHVGSTSEDCGDFDVAPQTIKYSYRYSSGGNYDFYLVDYLSKWYDSGFLADSFCTLKMRVNVVTSDAVQQQYAAGACGDKAWYVYSQDSATGIVNFIDQSKGWLGKKDLPPDLGGVGS